MKQIILFYPLVNLSKLYNCQYGYIGPVSKTITKFPKYKKLFDTMKKSTVNGIPVKNPVVAISSKDSAKFISEIESIIYIFSSELINHAGDEIFSQKNRFDISTKNKKEMLRTDYSITYELSLSGFLRTQTFPRNWTLWDKEKVRLFEEGLQNSLSHATYKGLCKCLNDIRDKESLRERKRIITSIYMFNESFSTLRFTNPFSKYKILYIASAFEALLNLPSSSIAKSFEQTVYTLCGQKNEILQKWCKDFYNYRSKIIHGDTGWGDKDDRKYNLSPKEKLSFSFTAKELFSFCLNRKLFLMGLLESLPKTKFVSLNRIVKI